MKYRLLTFAIVLTLASVAAAQRGPGPMDCGPGMDGPMHGPMMGNQMMGNQMMGNQMMGGPGMAGPMMHGGMHGNMMFGPGGTWWKNSATVKKLGLSDSQVAQIDKIFFDHRSQLIDIQAALQKQELALEPLIEAAQPDEAQVTAQIDRVAQARANLEKSHAHMLLGIRRVLTADQWKQLHSEGMGPRPMDMGPKPMKDGPRNGPPTPRT